MYRRSMWGGSAIFSEAPDLVTGIYVCVCLGKLMLGSLLALVDTLSKIAQAYYSISS